MNDGWMHSAAAKTPHCSFTPTGNAVRLGVGANRKPKLSAHDAG
jgi:hypothetical protein